MTSQRQCLPYRRAHELIDFEHGGFRFTADIGRGLDGRLQEIFLNAAKTGMHVETAARDAAIVASLALQHGVSTEALRHALTRNPNGTASGPLGAVLDLLKGSGPGGET
jgi:ribonucleoside-diphosphate reductase alpha chain